MRVRRLNARFVAMLAAAMLPICAYGAWVVLALPAFAQSRAQLAAGALAALGATASLCTIAYSRLCAAPRDADRAGAADAASAASVAAITARVHDLERTLRTNERQAALGRVIAGLVHDLSHPVQNLANNATLLLRTDLDEAERFRIRRIIERESAALRSVMDVILDVARPRSHARMLVDVNSVVTDVVDAVRAEAHRHDVVLSARLAFDLPPIDGDRFALSRVLRNLVANAIQATGAGDSVTVITRLDAGTVTIEVTDTGRGIAADRLPSIFEEYVTTRQRGHGLGLAVSKQLVEQLDGAIGVTSEPGVGTCFTVRFPAAPARLVEAAS